MVLAEPREPLTIWYNTLCPVCRTGVDWQKKLLLPALQRGDIVFVDINEQPNVLDRFNCDLEGIRRRLHATKPDGSLLVGADVVAEVLSQTPGLGWFGRFMMMPGVRSLAHFSYDGFAALLYWSNRRSGRW